jgi:photosystem II stability/assembly factor-like uncharacterized protein
MVRLSRASQVALATVVVAALNPSWSHANGRTPATTGVTFVPGETETIFMPVTFGLLVSSDAGESFRWVCEPAIGYSGMYDPDYAVTAEGALYATSHQGLRISRDRGCTWESIGGPLAGDPFLFEVEIGADGRVWAATGNAGSPNDVFVSSDGESFASAGLASENNWWLSVRTTPADLERVYVSGLQPEDGEAPAAALLRRSVDGGKTWEELPVGDFVLGERPDLFVAGVSPTDPDVVFARAALAVNNRGDLLFRSDDGGATWQQVAEFADRMAAFHIRAGGKTVIAGSVRACPEDIGDGGVPLHGCVRISRDGGVTWQRTEQQPRLACIGERSDGVLFGCGGDFPPDEFALARSDDGETWEPVFRLADTVGPAECEAGKEQAECAVATWPGLCETIGKCMRPDTGGRVPDAGPPMEDTGDGGGGCCRVGGAARPDWLAAVALALAFLLARRRR